MPYPALLHSTTPSPPLYSPLHAILPSNPLTIPSSLSYPPLYLTLLCPTPLHSTIPPVTLLHSTILYHTFPPYLLCTLPTIHPHLPYSTPIMSLHSTLPSPPLYPTHPPLPNSILPSLPYHALYLTLLSSPLPYHTCPTPLYHPFPSPMSARLLYPTTPYSIPLYSPIPSPVFTLPHRGARWLSGRVSDSGARGPGFETYRRHVVSLSKTLYSPKVLVNYPGSDGFVPT